jgi:5-methylcytosine-specific restriction endonuclease McrA
VKERIPWDEVHEYFSQGHTIKSCCERFGFTYAGWVKAAKRGRIDVQIASGDLRRRHAWSAVQIYYDEGHSLVQCIARFGFSRGAWDKAKRRGEIRPRPLARPLDVLLATSRSRNAIKRRLLGAGLLQNRCEHCGLSDWEGKPLCVQIDHINGIRDDHRLENLRMLCPNCHSQTPTHANRRRPAVDLQGA